MLFLASSVARWTKGSLVLLVCLAGARARATDLPQGSSGRYSLSKIDVDLLDDLSRRSFRYFWEQSSPRTGLVLDRAFTVGSPGEIPTHGVASIAATGFGLAAVCIAQDHRWIGHAAAHERVLNSLRFLAHKAPQEHGWFYHFLDSETGERAWQSEVSSIDTALLLAGVLTVRQCMEDDPEAVALADTIYARVDFPWMMDGSVHFSHGWTPEAHFLPYRWDTYSELLILYVLGIGSPTHPIPVATWGNWKLPVVELEGSTYVGGGPLFIHQYSQAWLDLRGRTRDHALSTASVDLPVSRAGTMDYYANSVTATRALRKYFVVSLASKFNDYSANLWGITASDSAHGYTDWGSPEKPRVDGTIVPSAAAGSLMFAPDICIPDLRNMLLKFGKDVYGRYGFVDAFNPANGWVSPYVIGIDAGITLLSAENLRTGRVWRWFMSNPAAEHVLSLVGLKRADQGPQVPIDLISDPKHADCAGQGTCR